METKNPESIENWLILCKNTECRNRYEIPENSKVDWKIRKARGLCSIKCDTLYPELLEPVKCPKCGALNLRLIRKYPLSKTD